MTLPSKFWKAVFLQGFVEEESDGETDSKDNLEDEKEIPNVEERIAGAEAKEFVSAGEFAEHEISGVKEKTAGYGH